MVTVRTYAVENGVGKKYAVKLYFIFTNTEKTVKETTSIVCYDEEKNNCSLRAFTYNFQALNYPVLYCVTQRTIRDLSVSTVMSLNRFFIHGYKFLAKPLFQTTT